VYTIHRLAVKQFTSLTSFSLYKFYRNQKEIFLLLVMRLTTSTIKWWKLWFIKFHFKQIWRYSIFCGFDFSFGLNWISCHLPHWQKMDGRDAKDRNYNTENYKTRIPKWKTETIEQQHRKWLNLLYRKSRNL
jgi:hypothetical protein